MLGAGYLARLTPSLALHFLTSLTRTSEKAGIMHPVRVATTGAFPRPGAGTELWQRGRLSRPGARAHGWCMPGEGGTGGQQAGGVAELGQ